MKVETDTKIVAFTPFNITLTIESKEEAVKLFVLFCHNKILNSLSLQEESDKFRTALKKGADINCEDYYSLFSKLSSIVI